MAFLNEETIMSGSKPQKAQDSGEVGIEGRLLKCVFIRGLLKGTLGTQHLCETGKPGPTAWH